MTADVLLNDNFELSIQGGDFLMGASGNQHASLIVYSRPGWWKQNPWLGADFLATLNDDADPNTFRTRLQKNMELDGAKVELLELVGEELKLRGNYDA